MEQELNNLKAQFDEYINEIKQTDEYKNYQKAKQTLEECEEATNILNELKVLQKKAVRFRHDGFMHDVETITKRMDELHNEYDKIFEVAQFNMYYEEFKEIVENLKNDIENQMN